MKKTSNLVTIALLTFGFLSFYIPANANTENSNAAQTENEPAATEQNLTLTEIIAEPTMYPQTQNVMSCMVPADTVKVLMQVDLYNDTSNDFITFTLDEAGEKTVFYNQAEKGKISEAIKAGSLSMPVLTEKMEQENGVIKNVGLLSLSYEDEMFSGFLVAKSNIYPMICVSLLPKDPKEAPATKKPADTSSLKSIQKQILKLKNNSK